MMRGTARPFAAFEQAAEAIGHLDDEAVAGVVAKTVIDSLEAIEIEEEHRDIMCGSIFSAEHGVQPSDEEGSVWQPGQRVVQGVMNRCLIGLQQLGSQPFLIFDRACKRGVGLEEFRARRAQPFARPIEPRRRLFDTLLKRIEARGHGAEFVMRMDRDRHDVGGGMRRLDIAFAQRVHRSRQVAHGAERKPMRRLLHLIGGMGDHPRQNEPDADRQNRHKNEDVLQGDHKGLPMFRDGIDCHQIAGGIEREHEDHGPGELDMEAAAKPPHPKPPAILQLPPCIKSGAGIGHEQAEDHRRQAELLETEKRTAAPDHSSCEAKPDRAARRAEGPRRVGRIAAQKKDRDARQADADEIGEIGGGDDPDRIADQAKRESRNRPSAESRPRAHRSADARRESAGPVHLPRFAPKSSPRRRAAAKCHGTC